MWRYVSSQLVGEVAMYLEYFLHEFKEVILASIALSNVHAVTSDKKTVGASPSISLWTIHHVAIRPGFLRSWRLSWMIEWNRRRSQSSKKVLKCHQHLVSPPALVVHQFHHHLVTCVRPRALIVILLTGLPCFTWNWQKHRSQVDSRRIFGLHQLYFKMT